jgi:hypothetical protein
VDRRDFKSQHHRRLSIGSRSVGADAHDGVAGIWMELLEAERLDEIL